MAGDEGGIEEDMAEIGIAAFCDISLPVNRGAALMDSTINAHVGDELLRRRKAIDIADVGRKRCSGECANTGNHEVQGILIHLP